MAAKALYGLVVGALLVECWSFSLVPVSPLAARHFVAVPHQRSLFAVSRNVLFLSDSSDEEIEATSSDTVAEVKESGSKGEKKVKGLSMVPLFIKFCVVLAVKFVTDVVVYPPLLIFRLLRQIYKQLKSGIKSITKTGVNGEATK